MNENTPLLTNTNIARRNDPDTSHAGDRAVTASGKRSEQQLEVLAWLRTYPGRTARELAAQVQIAGARHLNHEVMHKRLPELAADHDRDGNKKSPLAKRGPKRACSLSGNKCATWYELGAEIPPEQQDLPI